MFAIARKDWKQFWRYPLNAVSNVFQPIIWITPVYFMGKAFSTNGKALGFALQRHHRLHVLYPARHRAGKLHQRRVLGMGYALKNDMDAGVMESNWLTPVPRLLILVGHSLTSLVVTAITSMVMLLFGGLIFGFQADRQYAGRLPDHHPHVDRFVRIWLCLCALVLLMREANTLVDISSFLVQIFSGTNFPVNALPRCLLPDCAGPALDLWPGYRPRAPDRHQHHLAVCTGKWSC